MLQQIENGEILQTDACVKLYSGTLSRRCSEAVSSMA